MSRQTDISQYKKAFASNSKYRSRAETTVRKSWTLLTIIIIALVAICLIFMQLVFTSNTHAIGGLIRPSTPSLRIGGSNRFNATVRYTTNGYTLQSLNWGTGSSSTSCYSNINQKHGTYSGSIARNRNNSSYSFTIPTSHVQDYVCIKALYYKRTLPVTPARTYVRVNSNSNNSTNTNSWVVQVNSVSNGVMTASAKRGSTTITATSWEHGVVSGSRNCSTTLFSRISNRSSGSRYTVKASDGGKYICFKARIGSTNKVKARYIPRSPNVSVSKSNNTYTASAYGAGLTWRYVVTSSSTCDSSTNFNTGSWGARSTFTPLAGRHNNKYVCFRATNLSGLTGYARSSSRIQLSGPTITVTKRGNRYSASSTQSIKSNTWKYVIQSSSSCNRYTNFTNPARGNFYESGDSDSYTMTSDALNGRYICFRVQNSNSVYGYQGYSSKIQFTDNSWYIRASSANGSITATARRGSTTLRNATWQYVIVNKATSCTQGSFQGNNSNIRTSSSYTVRSNDGGKYVCFLAKIGTSIKTKAHFIPYTPDVQISKSSNTYRAYVTGDRITSWRYVLTTSRTCNSSTNFSRGSWGTKSTFTPSLSSHHNKYICFRATSFTSLIGYQRSSGKIQFVIQSSNGPNVRITRAAYGEHYTASSTSKNVDETSWQYVVKLHETCGEGTNFVNKNSNAYVSGWSNTYTATSDVHNDKYVCFKVKFKNSSNYGFESMRISWITRGSNSLRGGSNSNNDNPPTPQQQLGPSPSWNSNNRYFGIDHDSDGNRYDEIPNVAVYKKNYEKDFVRVGNNTWTKRGTGYTNNLDVCTDTTITDTTINLWVYAHNSVAPRHNHSDNKLNGEVDFDGSSIAHGAKLKLSTPKGIGETDSNFSDSHTITGVLSATNATNVATNKATIRCGETGKTIAITASQSTSTNWYRDMKHTKHNKAIKELGTYIDSPGNFFDTGGQYIGYADGDFPSCRYYAAYIKVTLTIKIREVIPPCTGDDCPCTGDNCPTPPCTGDDCPCTGDNCPTPPCTGDDCPCTGDDCPTPPCTGDDCPCTGDNCPTPPCTGDDCPCTGDNCPTPPCTGDNCPTPPCTGDDCPCTGDNCPTPTPTPTPVPSTNNICSIVGDGTNISSDTFIGPCSSYHEGDSYIFAPQDNSDNRSYNSETSIDNSNHNSHNRSTTTSIIKYISQVSHPIDPPVEDPDEPDEPEPETPPPIPETGMSDSGIGILRTVSLVSVVVGMIMLAHMVAVKKFKYRK